MSSTFRMRNTSKGICDKGQCHNRLVGNLKLHNVRHHKVKTSALKCPQCPFAVTVWDTNLLVKHLNHHHHSVVTKKTVAKMYTISHQGFSTLTFCPKCIFSCLSSEDMNCHVTAKHGPPSTESLQEEVRTLLQDADLDMITTRVVRGELEKMHGGTLEHSVKFVNTLIVEEATKRLARERGKEPGEGCGNEGVDSAMDLGEEGCGNEGVDGTMELGEVESEVGVAEKSKIGEEGAGDAESEGTLEGFLGFDFQGVGFDTEGFSGLGWERVLEQGVGGEFSELEGLVGSQTGEIFQFGSGDGCEGIDVEEAVEIVQGEDLGQGSTGVVCKVEKVEVGGMWGWGEDENCFEGLLEESHRELVEAIGGMSVGEDEVGSGGFEDLADTLLEMGLVGKGKGKGTGRGRPQGSKNKKRSGAFDIMKQAWQTSGIYYRDIAPKPV